MSIIYVKGFHAIYFSDRMVLDVANKSKTNAMRILDSAGINYRIVTYEVDEKDLSGVHVAATCGLPIEQVYKTLVLHGDKTGYLVAVLPVQMELNLKALAILSGNKKVEMIAVKDLLPLTGYIRGGCSPVGMKKAFPTYVEESAILCEWISVSAGVRGVQLLLNPEELLLYLHAKTGDIAMK